MRILMVNDYSEKISGAEVYTHQLIAALESLGHTIEVFSSSVKLNTYNSKLYNKSLFSYLKRIFNPFSLIEFQKKYTKFKPDVIHVHGIFNELTPSIFLNINKTPIVMTLHNNQIVSAVSNQLERNGRYCKNEICAGCPNCVGYTGAIYEFLKRRVHAALLKHVSYYVTPSNYLERIVRKYGNFSNVKTIHNGFNLFQYKKVSHYKNLLYVGRLSKDKGLNVLLRAFARLSINNPDITLKIVGSGAEYDVLQKTINSLGLQSKIKIIRGVAYEDIQKYYYDSTALIIPSMYPDILPTVAIEALSCGLPIVASNIGGLPEIVKDSINGFLFEPDSDIDLELKIQSLLSKKETIDTFSKNSIKDLRKFSLQDNVNNLVSIYNSLLNNI